MFKLNINQKERFILVYKKKIYLINKKECFCNFYYLNGEIVGY